MATSEKMPTVEAFCSSQGLEGVWQERAKRLVAEVPGEEPDCTDDPIFVMFCHRGARVKAGRVQGTDQLTQRGTGGTCWQQTAQRGIFSRQVSHLSFNPSPLNLRFLRGSNWDVDIGTGLIAGSHRMIQDYYPYMSAGPPSALEHVWRRDLIFSPEMRDDEGRRVVVLRLGQWPPQEVKPSTFSQFMFCCPDSPL